MLEELIREAKKICQKVKNDQVLGDYFTKNNPWANRPWREFNLWNGWYALSYLRKPENILEIGTGFGFSTIALAKGAKDFLKLFVSLDIGIWSKEYGWQIDHLDYVERGIRKFKEEEGLDFDFRLFRVNTQPPPYTDDKNQPIECVRWTECQELIKILDKKFDFVLIDGKHTEEGLYNDLVSFFPYTREGSLVVCDDLQMEDVRKSYERFLKETKVTEYLIWDFLSTKTQKRIQGLILK